MEFWATEYLKTASARPALLLGTALASMIPGIMFRRHLETAKQESPEEYAAFKKRLLPVIGGDEAQLVADSTSKNPHMNPWTKKVDDGGYRYKDVLAHEYGHATGLGGNAPYRSLSAVTRSLSSLGSLAAPLIAKKRPHLAVPLSAGVAASHVPTIIEEIRATKRAREAMEQTGDWTPESRNRLLGGLGTYAASALTATALPLIVGLGLQPKPLPMPMAPPWTPRHPLPGIQP
jgi:hypothetical protein